MGLSYTQTFFLVSSCTLFYSLHGILFNLTRDSDGKIAYQVSTVVFLSEILKLLICVAMFVNQLMNETVKIRFSWLETVLLGVPGLIYAINNTMAFMLLNYVDPATFQLLSNMKVITTTVLTWIIMKKVFSGIQWISLVVLFVGSSLSTIAADPASVSSVKLGATTTGFIGMVVYCTLSALAGISTEYAMKINESTSIHYQNLQMYMFGVFFNFISCHYEGKGDLKVMFAGLQSSWWILAVIANQGMTGLLISAIMKFADNIVKLFCISGAAIVSFVLSHYLFGLGLNLTWFISASLITLSVYMYNYLVVKEYFAPEVKTLKETMV